MNVTQWRKGSSLASSLLLECIRPGASYGYFRNLKHVSYADENRKNPLEEVVW